jgi:prevent-host-death family protein
MDKPIKYVGCTIGFGPDILLGIDKNYMDSDGYVDLTINHAKKLVCDLQKEILKCDNIINEYEVYNMNKLNAVFYSQARNNFKKILDDVSNNNEVTVIVRSNGDNAVVMSITKYNDLIDAMGNNVIYDEKNDKFNYTTNKKVNIVYTKDILTDKMSYQDVYDVIFKLREKITKRNEYLYIILNDNDFQDNHVGDEKYIKYNDIKICSDILSYKNKIFKNRFDQV